jgi:hypothetical protein
MTVRDDTSVFLTFWRAAKAEDHEARVARYKTEVVPTFPGFWDYVAATAGDGGEDAVLRKRFAEFEAIEAKFEAAAARAPADFQLAVSAMRSRFPDFDPKVEVRFLHSLGKMDGGGRVFRGRNYLLFGIDMMVRYHTWGDDRPFYAHELFHMYQAQKTGLDGRNAKLVESTHQDKTERSEPLYFSLWQEGLATYVSGWVVPDASMGALMLDVPSGLIMKCEANLEFLVQDVLTKIDSKQTSDYADYFYASSKDPRRPGRVGYYLGYLIARSMHRRIPISELVTLQGEELRALMLRELPLLLRSKDEARNTERCMQ